jgi:hypothetical protein
MGFSAEMAGSGSIGCVGIPLEDGELGIAALNDKPVIWMAGDPSADFAPKFLKRSHAVALAW